jgi:hypothetical protein
MKLIHTRLARSIWLFDVSDLNPKGKDIISDLVDWVKNAYSFAVAPDPDNPIPDQTSVAVPASPVPQSAPTQAPGGMTFKRGNFQSKEEIFISIASLTIYTDGIVIDTTSSTEDGDRFADDLLHSAASEFKLAYDGETVRRKLYLSELIVRSDIALESLNPALAAFAKKLPSTFAGGTSLPFGVGSLAFWSEPNDGGVHRVFKIERQLGRAFSENRYYAEAPLATSIHFSLLEEFERVLGVGSG